jgi:hypothetical protein
MKKLLLYAAILLLAACHKKTTPVATAPPPPPAPKARVVVDGYGKIRTPLNQLPQGVQASYAALARSFTPAQLSNLKYRYNTIPPKVLYIPDVYAKTTAKGTYAVYKNKFWYWKKSDGLFHLDEAYYQ